MICTPSLAEPTRNVPVPKEQRMRFCLTDDEVFKLAKQALTIERYYSELAGRFSPMDIEWTKDGPDGELFIVQARPETVHARASAHQIQRYRLEKRGEVIVSGRSVGSKIAVGRARVIHDPSAMHRLQPGEVLVSEMTDPDWEPVMKIASAIVTNRGGRTCHAAIVARELGVPAVVGTRHATEKIADGEIITVSCAEGDVGYVYRGKLPYRVETIDLKSIPMPKTMVMMNVARPERAFSLAALPNAGVGLARLEFIINETIGIHPQAALAWKEMPEKIREAIEQRAFAYGDPVRFYREKLAEGIATIASAFYPKKVIVRLSDFKSNEYSNLLGGSMFEPREENPMIGYRGAARYCAQAFAKAFSLECQAIVCAREEKGLDNIALMVPFVRTPEEGRKVLERMEEHGLARGKNGLEIYMMCEVPSNVILADEFLALFDGFSIGSNDLTQLVLGVERDSEQVAHLFDERHPAVVEMIRRAIAACRRKGKYVGICGQAPSDFPGFVDFLVREGIDSISFNPDAVLDGIARIVRAEQHLQSA